MRRALVTLVLAALFAAGCDGGGDDTRSERSPSSSTTTSTTTAPSTAPATDLDAVSITLAPIADLDAPTAFAARQGDTALYVAEQGGTVRAVRDGQVAPEPVLDIGDRVLNAGEEGLLGIAFSPDGSKLYVHYSDDTQGGDNQLDEYAMNGEVADPASRRPILTVETLQPNHNGGQLAFAPDGYLYIALGDGGAGGDQGEGHAPGGNGQSLDTLLGKLLRIDPAPSGSAAYTIPDDNPFADGGGRPEIWAYGLRNPWRFSFDAETGDLWIGDVGQNAWEEVDFMPAGQGAGANYGWNRLEGTHPFMGDPPADAVAPITEYPNPENGCSVIGGFVYRGERIAALRGAYLFSDYCNSDVRALVESNGQVAQQRSLGVSADNIVAFGQDNDGELYVLSQSQGLLRIDPA